MKLLYIANIRLPTEKAHGLQIMQNCEAFAAAGVDVSLWTARRINTPALRQTRDVWAHYGVSKNFTLRRLPCLDLLPLVPDRDDALARLIFGVQLATFTLAALIGAVFSRADVYYSRDGLVLLTLSLIKPRHALAYEIHSLTSGRRLLPLVIRRVGALITTTQRLADDVIALGADPARVVVAHDGVRRDRFTDLPAQADARASLGWPSEAFIVGYVGRLHTMLMDKGVGTLVEALAQLPPEATPICLGLVGGPDDRAAALRDQWVAAGLPPERFLYAGQVPPDAVPAYLRAFDVCALPLPWTEHFAYYASPIKLFEYMAAGRPIVASDLPSTAEVVAAGETALLFPPGDSAALAAVIRRLYSDPALCERLSDRAHQLVMERYTWAARARLILAQIRPGW
ncbi:MAG: glycosyltransferase family 1 protein [Chloroflexi bacterium]|nr:glycosyltransferase family 1 protein [Chloroflexota bacterium]